MLSKAPWKAIALVIVSQSLAAATAYAHHSFASVDMRKTLTVSGTIKEFRWGAPHSSMVLTYKSGDTHANMSVISGSPYAFTRAGFAPRDFKRGDKVTVVYHPNVNGLPGGAMAKLILPDGRTYSDTETTRAAAQ